MKQVDNSHIKIRGARVHNLKNVDIDIPLNQIICLAGPSGSGKTSLAFHTLLSESRRRFVNSFPNSMKFFADRPAAVDVDSINPVLPVFGLPQINPVMGSRGVVSDLMRLTDNLQNLYFSKAEELCPVHLESLETQAVSEQIKKQLKGAGPDEVYHLIVTSSEYIRIFSEEFLPARSFSVNRGTVDAFNEADEYWEVLRFKAGSLSSVDKKWEELKLSSFNFQYLLIGPKLKKPAALNLKLKATCPKCDFESKPKSSVSAFSPYSALGACPACNGYGANLVYDDNKLLDKELSIEDGGLKLLNYSPFHDQYAELLKVLKKEKISTTDPIKKLPKKFLEILNSGHGQYEGFDELKKYLESKRYKPSVRIYIRNLQKEVPCIVCSSSRLNPKIHHYKITFGHKFYGMHEIMGLTINDALEIFKRKKFTKNTHEQRILNEILEKLSIATSFGLGHLSLLRKNKSLSAGEYQRLLLIKYLSFKGVDSLFVLDEPSLGLGLKEQEQLMKGLREIIKQGNTIILIDHTEYLQQNSDHLIVMGPSSGKLGGEVLFAGAPSKFLKLKENFDWAFKKVQSSKDKFIRVEDVEIYNKKINSFEIPLGQLTWAHGDSGTGKSSTLIKVMANVLYKKIHGQYLEEMEFKVKNVKSDFSFEDVIVIASELNRFTSRSSVGTITELASVIRKHFLKLPISKSMDLKEGHLSHNSELGMCPKCEGRGHLVIEMQYLEDIVLECEECRGLKLRPIYANISDGKMTVSEAFELPLSQVLERIDLTPKFRRIYEYLKILNLDYLSLNRGLNSLSGGEKQRIYLLSKLMKSIQNSLLIFENLSFGLSEKELHSLCNFLQDLLILNNTIIIIDSSPIFKKLAPAELIFTHEKVELRKIK